MISPLDAAKSWCKAQHLPIHPGGKGEPLIICTLVLPDTANLKSSRVSSSELSSKKMNSTLLRDFCESRDWTSPETFSASLRIGTITLTESSISLSARGDLIVKKLMIEIRSRRVGRAMSQSIDFMGALTSV
jgi:hypothetical protein